MSSSNWVTIQGQPGTKKERLSISNTKCAGEREVRIAYTFNLNIWETEVEGFFWVWDQLCVHALECMYVCMSLKQLKKKASNLRVIVTIKDKYKNKYTSQLRYDMQQIYLAESDFF